MRRKVSRDAPQAETDRIQLISEIFQPFLEIGSIAGQVFHGLGHAAKADAQRHEIFRAGLIVV